MCCWCFFFKQKTAYEMRISDWSSDVCSSDLRRIAIDARHRRRPIGHRQIGGRDREVCFRVEDDVVVRPEAAGRDRIAADIAAEGRPGRECAVQRVAIDQPADRIRSEEHTSELQSLMRSSYAVFCLKKQKSSQTEI